MRIELPGQSYGGLKPNHVHPSCYFGDDRVKDIELNGRTLLSFTLLHFTWAKLRVGNCYVEVLLGSEQLTFLSDSC